MEVIFHRRFSLIWPAVSEMRQVLKHILGTMNVSTSELDNIGLAVTEYLTNLLRHSAGEDSTVVLQLSKEDSSFKLALIDKLKAYNFLEKNDSDWQIGDGLVEGGMGVALIRHYFPDADYFSKHGKNTFQFSIKPNPNKPTLVYIEDSISERALISGYLNSNYEVHCFSDIESGWKGVLSLEPSIVLLDYHLKGQESDKFINRLNHHQIRNSLSLIILTGEHDPQKISALNYLGIDDFLNKPVSKIKLLQSIERVRYRFDSLKRSPNFINTEESFEINSHFSASLFGSIVTGDGGDFIYPIKNGFIFGDIMGHGLQALKETFAVKGFISGFVANERPLNELFKQLNIALWNQKLCRSCVVSISGFVVEDNKLQWINAGMPNPICVDEEDGLIELSGNSPLLGLSEDPHYFMTEIDLSKFKSILFYTDGIVENKDTQSESLEVFEELTDNVLVSDPDFGQKVWLKSITTLSKEIDDASLVVLNYK